MRRSIITLSLTLVVLVAGAFLLVRARDDKPAQPPAQGAAQQAGAKFYSEGLAGVDFTGLDATAKQRALKILNENKCDCNCDMTIAQCRVEDKTCPRSPGLAAAVINGIRAGKSDAEVVAAIKPAAGAGVDQPVQPVPRMEIATTGAPAKGKEGAKVTVVAFEDFQCPYCARSAPVLQKILETYPSDVRVVFKHYPLSFHKNAKPAAIASFAAQKQGKFWEMYEVLFKNQNALDEASLRKHAESVGLDMAAYDKAYADPATVKVVDEDMADASKAGVQGTPTLFVNGVQSPTWEFTVMQKLIEAAKSGGDVGQTAGQVKADLMAQMRANRPAPPDPNKVYEIDIAGAPTKGPADASVTLVEFSDYQ